MDNWCSFVHSVEGSSQNGRKQGTDETATAKNSASYIGKRLLVDSVKNIYTLECTKSLTDSQ